MRVGGTRPTPGVRELLGRVMRHVAARYAPFCCPLTGALATRGVHRCKRMRNGTPALQIATNWHSEERGDEPIECRASALQPVELFVGELVAEVEALVADADVGFVQRPRDRGHSSDAAEPLAETAPQASEQILPECDAGPDPARRADRYRRRPLRKEPARRQLSAEPAPGPGELCSGTIRTHCLMRFVDASDRA